MSNPTLFTANLSATFKLAPTKGKLVYEYNPFLNLTDTDGIHDLVTEKLNFDLSHPLDMVALESYDGSVSLIINDNKNQPKIINSRFTKKENNTYEIIDRVGENDTNLYRKDHFEYDTTLYKTSLKFPKIELVKLQESGNLKVGLYVFYIKYVDSDDNDTDFVAESGIVSCFIGHDGDPFSINGGYKELNSFKSVLLQVTNLDLNYSKLKVYYTRVSSDIDENAYTSVYEINLSFNFYNTSTLLNISGDEAVTEHTLSDLNLQYLICENVRSQAICQNRLFFGNISKANIDYDELRELSLYIYPKIKKTSLLGTDYYNNLDNSYFSSRFIYNTVGYWNEEIYRFGIVYILKDGSLSPVFNIRGRQELNAEAPEQDFKTKLNNDENLKIDLDTFYIEDTLDNAKGVSRILLSNISLTDILGIEMTIDEEVKAKLKNHCIGFFFVRLKRIPTILAQAYLMNVDKEAGIPLIKTGTLLRAESFLSVSSVPDEKRKLTHRYSDHLIVGLAQDFQYSAICPAYDIQPLYYNQILTGSNFPIKKIALYHLSTNPREPNGRLYTGKLTDRANGRLYPSKISAIPDNTPLTIIDNYKFRGVCGEAATAYKFRYLMSENKTTEATNLIRGIFGPQLGIVCESREIEADSIVNIYIPEYAEGKWAEYFKIRYEDNSSYYAISHRYSLDEAKEITECYRGDCYICPFTHRLNRNFLDPDAPINDIIVDANTWRDKYQVGQHDSEEKKNNINRGDVNAVELGSWITILVRSTLNLCLRALDYSYPLEEGLTGKPRGFYPLQGVSAGGESKIPESSVLNAGFGRTVGERWNYTLPDVPYYKNIFQTRIAYSDISIDSAFKNGYRTFKALSYRDYPTTYGGLMKLVEVSGNLLAIFEHGIALIPVNERTVAGASEGGEVFINTSNVLPLNPSVISDTYGTQWPESVIKTDSYVYGVDTVAKKIWRVSLAGGRIELISDLKVQKFLNDNITLTERELTPFIGIRNVKTHYNAFKQDIMFTFYDMLNTNEETVWNLCFNELQNKFITFYSWVPSYSANIDNMFFSFDRDTSKWVSKLGLSCKTSNSAYGICLDEVVIETPANTDYTLDELKIPLSLKGVVADSKEYSCTFKLIESRNNTICKNKGIKLSIKEQNLSISNLKPLTTPVLFIDIKCEIKAKSLATSYLQLRNGDRNGIYTTNIGEYTGTVAITTDGIINKTSLFEETEEGSGVYKVTDGPTLFTHFWKHGQAGIIDIKDPIKPCFWYGKQHPFEFEFIVADKPDTHKVFDNLRIISNKTAPESFHYEVVGEVYDFAEDKKNMYYRQEATKALFNRLGSDITYNHNLNDLLPLKLNIKSTTFIPAYYRQDHIDKIQDSYKNINTIEEYWIASTGDISREYKHLSGAELVYDPQVNEFKIWNHAEGVDIKKYGRRLGNMQYLEDCWEIQINSLIFALKNENNWVNNVPPISIVGPLPGDIVTPKVSDTTLEGSEIKDKYNLLANQIQVGGWTQRKETKMRDKFIRIRVRYSGKDLAVIMALKTFYTISYA